MKLPVTVDLATDVASFVIYHPDDVAHRYDAEPGWWFDEDFAVEAAAGRILGWETGSDGDWGIRLTDRAGELPLVPGRSTDFLLVVTHGRVLHDDHGYVPERGRDPEAEPHESLWIDLPNGRYRVTVSLVDQVSNDTLPEYEVLFTLIGADETVTTPTELARLRPTIDTLGRVVNDWVAHPDDPVVSAYERWLICLDSGEPIAILPNATGDAPAGPPRAPERAGVAPTAATSMVELKRLIAEIGMRDLVKPGPRHMTVVGRLMIHSSNRLPVVLAGRLLTYAGIAGWLREHLPLTEDGATELDALPRQARFDALVARLEDLAAAPAGQSDESRDAEQRLLRRVPSLEIIELPVEPVLTFRDPPGPTLPGCVLRLTVPAELAETAASASVVGLVTTAGIDLSATDYGYPGTLADVRDWDPLTSTLTVEPYAFVHCLDPAVADQPVSLVRFGFSSGHRPVGLPIDLATAKTLVARAAERHPEFAAGPPGSVAADQVQDFQTVDGVSEWLLGPPHHANGSTSSSTSSTRWPSPVTGSRAVLRLPRSTPPTTRWSTRSPSRHAPRYR